MSTARVVTLILVILLTGCQYFEVQSKQLNSIIDALNPESKALRAPQWDVQFGGYYAKVQPVIAGEATVFVNNLDAISFDGWRITKVSGLDGFNPAWEIQNLGNVRVFVVDDRVVAKHQCDPWLRHDTETGIRFEQRCTGTQSYTNMIWVGSLGQITEIQQVVDSSLMMLRLRLND